MKLPDIQGAKWRELENLFNKAVAKPELSLGGRTYTATAADSNKTGNVKSFDTKGLSDSELDAQVRTFVRQLTSGAPLTPYGNPPNVWATSTLPDGSIINIRSVSNSVFQDGTKPRLTVEVVNSATLNPYTKTKKNEIKFR